MSAPKLRMVDSDDVLSALLTMTNIQAARPVACLPDSAALRDYGLKSPYSTAEFSWKNADGSTANCQLLASRPQEGRVYLMRSDTPVIYEVDAQELPWLEFQYEDLISRMPLLPFILDVQSVSVTGGDWFAAYQLEPDGNDVQIRAEEVLLDSKRFKQLYRCFIDIPAEQYTAEQPAPDAPVLLSITYRYHDGRPESRLELVEANPVQCYLSVDGQVDFLTKSRYIQTIQKNIKSLANGGEIVPLY